jgi:hypothetical protein
MKGLCKAVERNSCEPDECGDAQVQTRKSARNVQEISFGYVGYSQQFDFCGAGSGAECGLAH